MTRFRLPLVVLLAFFVSTEVPAQESATPRGKGWGPEEALGPPDTLRPGDRRTAWASKSEDEQDEWLELEYERAVIPCGVRVVASFNPGALTAVHAVADGERTSLLWSGQDPVSTDREWGTSLIPTTHAEPIRRIRLSLASKAVEGWNEIDAVGLHGLDGSLQWATWSRASSSFRGGKPETTQRISGREDAELSELPSHVRTEVDELFEVFTELRVRGLTELQADVAREILDLQAADSPGTLGFEGAWKTRYGTVTLELSGEEVSGSYPRGKLTGRREGRRLVLKYSEETGGAGDTEFELGPDGQTLMGRWRTEGSQGWLPWNGTRINDGGITWLVVLETPWQEGLDGEEYSFGAMLSSIFEHAPKVEVRQRFFHDAASFHAYCEEASRLPGRVILSVAAHGDPRGVYAGSTHIRGPEIAKALATMGNLDLAHFSSCSVMGGAIPDQIAALRKPGDGYQGTSGYTVPVDWMGSALCEFLYFELLLGRELPAEEAARMLPHLFTVSETDTPPGSPIPALHFRFEPRKVAAALPE